MKILFTHLDNLKGFSKFAYLFSTSVALVLLALCLILRFIFPLSSAFLFYARETVATAAGIFLIGLIISVFFNYFQKQSN